MLNWIKTSKCPFAEFIRRMGEDYRNYCMGDSGEE